MKTAYLIPVLSAMLLFTGCNLERGRTHHAIETDTYTLTVSGQRLKRQAQVDSVPIFPLSYSGDTVRLHGNIQEVARRLRYISDHWYKTGFSYRAKGYYVLNLELIGKPGTDRAAVAGSALRQLAKWGYVNIDSSWYQPVWVYRKGDSIDITERHYGFATGEYEFRVPDSVVQSTVGKETIEEHMWDYYDSKKQDPEELLAYFFANGLDTIHIGEKYLIVTPTPTRRYRPFVFFFPYRYERNK